MTGQHPQHHAQRLQRSLCLLLRFKSSEEHRLHTARLSSRSVRKISTSSEGSRSLCCSEDTHESCVVSRISGSSSLRISRRRYPYTHSLSVRWPMISFGVHLPSNGRARRTATRCLATILARVDAVWPITSIGSRPASLL